MKLRGRSTGLLFLEQSAPFPGKPYSKKWERPLRIAVIQSVVPSVTDFTTRDLQLNDNAIRKRHRQHLRAIIQGVAQMLRIRETHVSQKRDDGRRLDLLVLPELAVHPKDINSILIPFVRSYRCVVLAGLTYHPFSIDDSDQLINSAVWLIPEWTPQYGLQVRQIEQGKGILAPSEKLSFGDSLTGFRPAQWIVQYIWQNRGIRPLMLSGSVCYDATDLKLASDLRDRSDIYAICALNQDVGTFDNLATDLNYLMYQGVLVVNNGTFGGSSFFAPLQKEYLREVLHFHGQPQSMIGFGEIDPLKMIMRPNLNENLSPRGFWKRPPAGWIGPKG